MYNRIFIVAFCITRSERRIAKLDAVNFHACAMNLNYNNNNLI